MTASQTTDGFAVSLSRFDSNPTCPELVYVPTVFLSPSLSADDFQVDPDSEIIEQVDVVQTALSAIGFDDKIGRAHV